MSIALNAAASALQIAKIKLDVIANDIANKNTTGYKACDVRTSDLSYTSITRPSIAADEDSYTAQVQVGNGAKVTSTTRMMQQGALKHTNLPLDMMIRGSGYFAVALPNGSRGYTRDGSFRVSNSMLVTQAGEKVLGEGEEIEIKPEYKLDTLEVSPSGAMKIQNSDGEVIEIGRIMVHHFGDEQALEAIGNNTFIATQASGDPQELVPGEEGAGLIEHKSLESSNVDTVKVVMDLMEAQNVYEIAFKVMEALNKIERKANEIITV
jgi:flagellar basal-body rod protein FlgG